MGQGPGQITDLLKPLSGGLQIGGSILEARGAQEDAEAAARAARFNANLAIEEARINARRKRRANRKEIGRQRALIGKSGIRAEGTVLNALVNNAFELELEAADLERQGFNTASLDLARASAAERTGRRVGTAALIKGGVGALNFFAKRGTG